MKIAIVISDINQCGGTERTVISVANFFYLHNYDIEIISLFSNKQDIPFFHIENGIKIKHLGIKSYTNKSLIYKIQGWFRSICLFRKAISESKADLLMGTSRNTNFLSIIFRAKMQKVIGCEHFAFNVPMNNVLRIIRDISYRKLDRLVVLTKRDKDYYSHKNIFVDVIPNALPFINKELKPKKKIAIAIGRHTEQKGFDKLISIWKKIEDHNNAGWKLIILGEGPLLEQNKNIATKLNVRTIEFRPFTKNISDVYNEASLYLMTSNYEAFPMVLIEAKNHGCVCVAYDCDTGPREIIHDGEDGIIINIGDESQFIEEIFKLINDGDKIKRMSSLARENSKIYTQECIYPKWIELIQSIQL